VNVVDSSGWLEYFAGTERAEHFEEPIQATDRLLVPAICLYEVYKIICRQRSETDALMAIAQMREGTTVDVDYSISIEGARISQDMGLPMADSLILAVARRHSATLWTQDADFKDIAGVRYIPGAS
jgi:predicted nucleic acid-binding protein